MVARGLIPAFVLGLTASVSLVTSCPSGCSCSNANGGVTADCSGRGLTEIPTQGVDANTKSLMMGGNQLTIIRAGFLSSYPDVEELFFDNNRIEVLEPLAFAGLKLKRLRLNGNRIQDIRGETFKGIEGQCDPEAFRFIKDTTIKFARWPIQDLNQDGDWPCTIDLRDNPITMIRSRAFSESSKYTVYLGQSHIGMTIQTEAFENTNDILGVHIVKIPTLTLSAGTFDGMGSVGWILIDETETSLTNALFGTTTRPRWIRISNSNILSLSSDALKITMDIMKKCDVNTNPYGPARVLSSHISTLEKGGIEFVSNTLPALPNRLLDNAKIGGIHFFGNTIAGLGSGIFERSGQPDVICIIMFSENRHDSISSEAFKNTQDVTHFVLNPKFLKSIDSNAFTGSRNIGQIRMIIQENENLDTLTIKSNAFSNINTVKIFNIFFKEDMPGKPELVIEPYAFSEFRGIEYMTIELAGSMSVFPDNLFTGLTVNQNFVIRVQQVTRIYGKAFGGPGESSIARLEFDGTVTLSCDCETSKLSTNVKRNVEEVKEGITCSGSLDTIASNCRSVVPNNNNDDDDDTNSSVCLGCNSKWLLFSIISFLYCFRK